MSEQTSSTNVDGTARLSSGLADQVLRMKSTRIFVVGDVILDQYISGKVNRISPEAPVPVLLEMDQKSVLGGAANVAANIASFGAQAILAGRVGADADGDTLKRACLNIGVDTTCLIACESRPTTRKLRILAGYQQIVRIDAETVEPLTAAQENIILDAFRSFARDQDVGSSLVISDYGKGVCTPNLLSQLIDVAKKHSIPVITDPKSSDLSRYRGTTFIKPNLNEGREILRRKDPDLAAGAHDPNREVSAILTIVQDDCQATHVVLSLSEKGVIAKSRHSDDLIRFSSDVLQVADVSGAGDTMIAFLAMASACNIPVSRCVQLANIAAGSVCAKLGTATLTSAEFLEAFQEREGSTHPEKLVTVEEATRIADEYRRSGRKIVFTNGCFDLLHAGHVKLLQQARDLGNVLFLGLNSDASIKRLKGPERPVQNEGDRAAITAGLGCVNYIVLFQEDTPLDLIAAIKPDLIVKGGDYNPEDVVGAEIVQKSGGKVIIVPLLEGRSTTRIIEKSKRP